MKAKGFARLLVTVVTVLTMMMTSVNVQAYSWNNGKDADICQHSTCKKKKMSGSSYCSSHTCSYPGCYKMVNSANEKCSSHKNAAYPSGRSSSGSNYSYSSKSSSSYSKKSDPYHASDYDDYEDFYEDYYDDFEGIDDAEDYWDDHHSY